MAWFCWCSSHSINSNYICANGFYSFTTYLSDAISGRDKALEDLRTQINELSKILVIETKDKEEALNLSQTEKNQDTEFSL